jgi:hypothetical protein
MEINNTLQVDFFNNMKLVSDHTIKQEQQTPSPYRLVFIQTINNCQFCINPTGPVYTHNIDYLFGFTSCGSCRTKGAQAVTDWIEKNAYGSVKHLRDKEIKIRRSNGNIESGWYLSTPFIKTDHMGKEYIECINTPEPIIGVTLSRHCYIDTLLELN